MSRLPTPGQDSGDWGEILNDYLTVAHQANGALKPIALAQVVGLTNALNEKANGAALNDKVDTSALSAVATTGSYDDLIDKPALSVSDVTSVNSKTGIVVLVKSDIGLSNVDNTSDSSKPISTAVQTALNAKQPSGEYATTAELATKASTSHAHSQSDVTGLSGSLAAKADITAAVLRSVVTAKGDVLVATANSTVSKLPVGADSQILTVDSASATGLRWAASDSLTGAQGPQGPPGLIWRGAWSTNTSYGADDAVQYSGRGFIALQASTGISPPSTAESNAYWDLLVDRGEAGGVGTGSAFIGEIIVPIPKAIDVNSTTFSNRYDPVVFDLSRYPANASIHFRTDISQANSGSGLVEARLACMTNNNAVVAGSTLSATVAQYNHSIQTSGNIRTNLQAGEALYSIEVRADATFNGQILSPAIVVRYS